MTCPSARELEALGRGAGDAMLRDHVAGCAACQARLSQAGAPTVQLAGGSEAGLASTLSPVEQLGLASTAPPAGDLGLAATVPPERAGQESAATGPAPGTRLGRYRLLEVLGAGGMGVVYAADDPELGRRVAVKLLHRGAADPGLRRRLVREARAMARVSHPNVIAVHDVGTVGEQVFVAMELVEGETLRTWLRRPRSRREIIDVFVQAGRGLAAAHAAGLVHRDFKPDNVLLGDGRVRVTDFGLAREGGGGGGGADQPGAPPGPDAPPPSPAADDPPLVTPDPDRAPLTHAGAVLGTPAYMAPEQHAGAHVDARSDQYGFAVALYEALHGERPFPEGSYEELVEAARAGRVREAPRGREVPSSLRRILLRALSPRPGDRFPTMGALLAALSRDRQRVPRAVARGALALLVPIAVAMAADWIARERATAVAHTSFATARDQLGRLLTSRSESFATLSELAYVLPVMRQVTAQVDEADFGLGAPEDDTAALARVHENLRSATWSWTQRGGVIAIADYKGRLLYTTAAPDTWGGDVTAVPALARAYQVGGEVTTALMRGDEPGLAGTGLLGEAPGPSLVVLFARAVVLADRPQAVFALTVPGEQLLADVSLGEGTQLSLLEPGGRAEGSVPPGVIARALEADEADGPVEVSVAGADWLVQRRPLGEASTGIGSIVLARQLDVGLAGLFVGARLVLGALAGLMLALALGATLWARRR